MLELSAKADHHEGISNSKKEEWVIQLEKVKNIMPTIKELMARDKIKSYNGIARALNREEE